MMRRVMGMRGDTAHVRPVATLQLLRRQVWEGEEDQELTPKELQAQGPN
jgi:hypothetical protein